MKIQQNRTKLAVVMTALVIGLVLSSATLIVPSVKADPLKVVSYDASVLKPGQVMTPFGPLDASHVHKYNGTKIDADAILKAIGVQSEKLTSKNGPFPGSNGWNEYAYWISGSSLTSFTAHWTVPSNPTSTYNGKQVVFLFPALQDSGVNVIIQPVLQWGNSSAYVGNNWELASWMCVGCNTAGTTGTAYYSTAISTTASHQISGSMNNDFGQTWTVTAQDTTSGTSTSEQVSTGTNFIEANVALESYGLPSQCGYLPGNSDFTSLSLSSSPTWSTNTNGTWCNMSPQVVSSSEVKLHTQS